MVESSNLKPSASDSSNRSRENMEAGNVTENCNKKAVKTLHDIVEEIVKPLRLPDEIVAQITEEALRRFDQVLRNALETVTDEQRTKITIQDFKNGQFDFDRYE